MKDITRHEPKQELEKFLTLPGEELSFITRRHFFTTFPGTIGILFLGIGILTALITAGQMLLISPTLFITGVFATLLITLSLFTKIIVDWYFHFYAVTTHKLLEVCYSPLFSSKTYEVLLDQVRCTEVDVRIDGMISQLLDMGTVVVTFDRPTHQEEFCLTDVKNPERLGIILGDILITQKQKDMGNTREVWYKTQNKQNRFRFTEEIFPEQIAQNRLYV